MYEDIAKLNPFYKEYHDFWNSDSEESSLTLSSNGSTKSSSLRSIPSSRDSFRPLEVSSSPTIRHFHSHSSLDAVYLHEGNEHQPTYEEYDGQDTSQLAALDYADSIKRPLSPIDEPGEDCDTDVLELELIRPQVHPSKLPHKKLFGEKSLLGRTTEVHAMPLERRKSQMFKAFGKKIKKQVEVLVSAFPVFSKCLPAASLMLSMQTDDVAKVYPNSLSSGSLRRPGVPSSSTARVSLDPATQAKLYADMEYMICLRANDFLVQQHSEGRISPDSIKKINNLWGSKNRPQVVEFHFDQATQRRLIISNLRDLRFNGECSTNPILLSTNLHNWKAIAKEMSVRTFCTPDSAIRKHMHDIHKILDMLGTPVSTFLAFEDLQMRTLSLMNHHLRERYRSGYDSSTLSGSRSCRSSSTRGSEDSWRMYQTKC